MNVLLFVCDCYVLSYGFKNKFASTTQVLSSVSVAFIEPYLLASLITLIVFICIRMKWRRPK